MEIKIQTIPHQEQRYNTVGDWYYDADGNLIIKVSKLSDKKREMLIAIHELVEVLCCEQDGIPQLIVDSFDMEYEKNRAADDDSEPGDSPRAPYHRQHCLATGIERILAAVWKVDWMDYEHELFCLPEVKPKQ